MSAGIPIEANARQRVRLMLKNSPTFVSFLKVAADLVDARIHDRQVIENLDPANPSPAARPLALIHTPKFDYFKDSLGERNEYRIRGSIRVLLESQFLGVDATQGNAMLDEFESITGQIRRELVELLDDPLGTTAYLSFTSIHTATPAARTLFSHRTEVNDFFGVGWLFSLGDSGGGSE